MPRADFVRFWICYSMEPIQLMVKTSAWPFFFHVKTYLYPSMCNSNCPCNNWLFCCTDYFFFLVVWLWFYLIGLAYTNRMPSTACRVLFWFNFYDRLRMAKFISWWNLLTTLQLGTIYCRSIHPIWTELDMRLSFDHKVFQHVETLFVQGNIFVLNQNKPPCLVIKKEVNYC